jgi:hypothetical protein
MTGPMIGLLMLGLALGFGFGVLLTCMIVSAKSEYEEQHWRSR